MNLKLVRPLYRDPYFKYELQSGGGTGVLSQLFHENALGWYKAHGWEGHGGLDIIAPTGMVIYAAHTGWVNAIETNPQSSGGLALNIITHENYDGIFYETYYGHAKEILVRIGDNVTPETSVAIVDNTGESTGPHLHFGLKQKRYKGGPQKNSSYETLNRDNGYFGNLDSLPFLKPMADEYTIVGKEQFFRVGAKWYHITNAAMLRALMDMGMVQSPPKVGTTEPPIDYEIAALIID